MKTMNFLAVLLASSFLFTSCGLGIFDNDCGCDEEHYEEDDCWDDKDDCWDCEDWKDEKDWDDWKDKDDWDDKDEWDDDDDCDGGCDDDDDGKE